MGGFGRKLPRSFFDRDVVAVAPDLLGRVLVAGSPDEADGQIAVRITEVEAYRGLADPASHSFRGPTARNQVMFGPPGHLYVYLVYGIHWCANLVTGPGLTASAVLLRAGEVVHGIPLARARRPAARTDAVLARGPAGLATVLGLTGADTGLDVAAGRGKLVLREGIPTDSALIEAGPRVGLSVGVEHPWRFSERGAASVSAFKAGGKGKPVVPPRTGLRQSPA